MNKEFVAVREELIAVIKQLKLTIPNDEPLSIAHGNWSFPGLTKNELIEEAQSIVALIDDCPDADLGEHEARISDYRRRLQHLSSQTIPNIWGNANQAVSAYLLTLTGLRNALAPIVTRDRRAEALATFRKLAGQLRGMESRFKALEPRTAQITAMLERIEQAFEAADQLPTDLDALSEARQTIAGLAEAATKDQAHVLGVRERADEIDEKLKLSISTAEAVLGRCETAYSAATSVGLAAAFSERSDALAKSMWVWVGGLVLALGLGSYFGSGQLHSLSELLKMPDAAGSIVTLNLLLSLLSIGAPIWFAWLATKQIGQRFRLAEDYAFKASVARAYEGFRREAARFDEDMETRLLSSALARLDELPLRLVEVDTHGSPWHELASTDLVKQALKVVPGFATQVGDLAMKALERVSSVKARERSSNGSPAIED